MIMQAVPEGTAFPLPFPGTRCGPGRGAAEICGRQEQFCPVGEDTGQHLQRGGFSDSRFRSGHPAPRAGSDFPEKIPFHRKQYSETGGTWYNRNHINVR